MITKILFILTVILTMTVPINTDATNLQFVDVEKATASSETKFDSEKILYEIEEIENRLTSLKKELSTEKEISSENKYIRESTRKCAIWLLIFIVMLIVFMLFWQAALF